MDINWTIMLRSDDYPELIGLMFLKYIPKNDIINNLYILGKNGT